MELAGTSETFSVTASFVKLQPELAARVLDINVQLAGGMTDLAPGASPEAIAAEINRLSDIATENGVDAGPKLVGYDYDAAFPVLLKNLLKPRPMISWFVLAAIFGAVVSSLASMLNSASTIATIDLYQKLNPRATQRNLVSAGRVFVVIFVVIAAVIAGILVAGLAIFFNKTRVGRALRAVADDHQAAMTVGIPLKNIWASSASSRSLPGSRSSPTA